MATCISDAAVGGNEGFSAPDERVSTHIHTYTASLFRILSAYVVPPDMDLVQGFLSSRSICVVLPWIRRDMHGRCREGASVGFVIEKSLRSRNEEKEFGPSFGQSEECSVDCAV